MFGIMGCLGSWNVWDHGMSGIMGCLGSRDVSDHGMSGIMGCLGSWDVLDHGMSWIMGCLGSCDILDHGMCGNKKSSGARCPGVEKFISFTIFNQEEFVLWVPVTFY